jgi:hypothetical protein
LCNFGKEDKAMSCSSKADILVDLVSCALKDAVELASNVAGKAFNVGHEMSFFSQCPDHLVVVNSKTKMLLIAVEDKKPFSSKLTDKKCVLGQLLTTAS